jgi:hypothetical protein
MFVLKESKVTGSWRKICKEKLSKFHSSASINRMMELGMTSNMSEENRNACKILVGKAEEKSRRWVQIDLGGKA